ncbi:MAG: hypothetical protein V7638_4838, partial [Acidobacteriota bacterium]
MFIKPNRRLTRRISFNLVWLLLLLAATAPAALADEIAIWNFNDSDLNVDHGSGTLSSNLNVANILFATGTTNNARLGDSAGQSLSLQGGSSTANNGRNITFNIG